MPAYVYWVGSHSFPGAAADGALAGRRLQQPRASLGESTVLPKSEWPTALAGHVWRDRLYVEQAYSGHLEEPYRQAVVELTQGGGIVIRNYRPLQPQRWRGCARGRAEQLSQLRLPIWPT